MQDFKDKSVKERMVFTVQLISQLYDELGIDLAEGSAISLYMGIGGCKLQGVPEDEIRELMNKTITKAYAEETSNDLHN